MAILTLHSGQKPIAKQVHEFAEQKGLKPVLLHQFHPQNIVHLKAGESKAPYGLIHGCLFLAGFSKGGGMISAVHLPSGDGTRNAGRTRGQVAELVEKVGHDAVFAVVGLPSNPNALRQELLKIIMGELEARGAELHERHISRRGDEPNGVLIDPKNKEMHVFLKTKELP